MEEIKNPSGTSLLVPSVQELAKDKISTVPPRYIQSQHDELVINEVDGILEIPVIDMKKLLSLEYESLELSKLHLACKDWGFFQLVNHDVSSSLVEKVKLETQNLFNLPMSEKKKFWQTPQHMEGFGQAFVVSEEQKLDWADIFFMTTLPKHSRMPHLFPQLPHPIRDTFELYSTELKNLSMVIVEYMGKALKMDENEMMMFFEDGVQSMRMNYYPPCPQPEKVIGLTPHSDGSGVTILLQLNDVEGLQVRKDGMWVPVKPLPNAFIVNIGDILELVNHGIISSLVDKLKLEIQYFFNLPISEKKKFWQTPQHMDGFGQAFVLSEEQILDWADMFFMTTLPKNSRMPHLFPQLPLPLRDTLELYSQEMKNLAMVMVGHIGKALRIEEIEMKELFEDGIQMMRMNYYPPCPQPEKVIGITPHSDSSALTFLLQLNEVEGLQVRKDGMWVLVKPLPNAFIVNIGTC